MASGRRHGSRFTATSAALVAWAILLGTSTGPADARLSAPPVHLLPGLERARTSDGAGVGALTRYLPKRLARSVRSARRDAAAAAGRGQRVQVTVLELGKAKRARRVAARWGAGARRAGAKPRRVRVGRGGWLTARGAQATVVWRSRSGVGVVRLRGRGQPSRAQEAVSFARLADLELNVPPPATAWGRVLAQARPDGSPSKRAALQAFSLAFKRLPGVRVPRGPLGEVDGGLAEGWILRYRSSLTAKQRRIVDRELAIRTGGRSSAGAEAAVVEPGCETTLWDITPSDFTYHPGISAFVIGFINEISKRAKFEPNFSVCAGTMNDPTPPAVTTPFDFKGDGHTWLTKGPMRFCRVRVSKGWMANANGPTLRLALAHEAFHCVHAAALGTRAFDPDDPSRAPWLREGMANWAGSQVSPISYQDFYHLAQYVEFPVVPPLFEYEEGYAAVGFFGHLDDALGDLWPNVLNAVTAESNVAAFIAAGGNDPGALASWGSSRFRIPEGGPAWTMDSPLTGPFEMPTYYVVKPGGEIGIPGFGHVVAKEYTARQAHITVLPDHPIVRIKADGYARLLPLLGPGVPAKDKVLKDGEVWLRAEGDGACPSGWAGAPPPTEPWSFPSVLGVTGPAGVEIQSYRLEDFCEPPPAGSGAPLDCSSGGCGSSNGDPHLETFDGRRYDFQAVGEYTLVKSRSGDLEVQARQQPARTLGGIPNDTVSVNSALAMRVAGARVGVYTTRKGMRLRVNGRPVSMPTGDAIVKLPGGGALAERARELAVLWPDGSEARVWSVPPAGVATMVLPAASRRGELVGLLGNFDDQQSNDFATRGGKRLRPGALLGGGESAFRRLYRTFGDSWRIRQRDSLFDYPRGRSTRSYTRRDYPSRRLSLASLSRKQRRRAEAICRAAGVRDRGILDSCILDVAATGVRAFARDAETLEATAKRSGPWTRLSSVRVPPGGAAGPAPASLASAGERVVAAYPRGDSGIDAATFTPDPGGVRDVARTTVVDGWLEVAWPFLLPAPGGALQVLFDAERSVNPDDPLNGVVLATRRPDGSFGVPSRAAEDVASPPFAATATATGVPIWATPGGPTIWRGAANATPHDLGDFAGGGLPESLARDASGRIWLAWQDFTGGAAELFLGELDPATGEPAQGAAPQRVPVTGAEIFDGAELACAATCRLVFSHDGRAFSWAPGEPAPTEVARGEVEMLAAAVAPDGRLWTVWTELASSGTVFLVKAKLGDTKGAGGSPVILRAPGDGYSADSASGLALPGRLVLAVQWSQPSGSLVWATVVAR